MNWLLEVAKHGSQAQAEHERARRTEPAWHALMPIAYLKERDTLKSSLMEALRATGALFCWLWAFGLIIIPQPPEPTVGLSDDPTWPPELQPPPTTPYVESEPPGSHYTPATAPLEPLEAPAHLPHRF